MIKRNSLVFSGSCRGVVGFFSNRTSRCRIGARCRSSSRELIAHGRYHASINEQRIELGRKIVELDCRPSDAIALAVRSGAPIFVSEPLLDAEGQVPADDSDDEETILDEFRDFLADVDPEDFAG